MIKINEVIVVFENCESVSFKGSDILDFKVKEDAHTLIKSFNNSACKLITKTHNSFLLKVSNSAEQISDFGRTDVAAIEVFFERGIQSLFNVEWGKTIAHGAIALNKKSSKMNIQLLG